MNARNEMDRITAEEIIREEFGWNDEEIAKTETELLIDMACMACPAPEETIDVSWNGANDW